MQVTTAAAWSADTHFMTWEDLTFSGNSLVLIVTNFFPHLFFCSRCFFFLKTFLGWMEHWQRADTVQNALKSKYTLTAYFVSVFLEFYFNKNIKKITIYWQQFHIPKIWLIALLFVGWAAQLSMLNNLQKVFSSKASQYSIHITLLYAWTAIVGYTGKATKHSFRPASLCAIPAP